MNLNQLIADLSLAGVKLWVDGEELRVRAPKGVLTLERRDLLKLHKAELVSMLRSNHMSASDTDLSLVRVSREQHLPLSFAQQQMWVLSELSPNSPLYNVPLAVRLKGSLNVVALWQSINEIIQRHEALRTTFRKVNGQPIQAIASTLNITIPVVDLRDQSDNEREIQAQRLATKEAQRPFDLASDPMLRGLLLHLEEAEYILLLTMHHIAFDGWSANIFFRELAALYEAYCNDLPSPLPQIPIQYADFAHWQRGWLQGEVLESKLAYWKQQLQDAPTVLELPTDRPRSAVQPFPGATYSRVVPKKLTEALTVLSQLEDVTLFMTLFTAFQILLYRYTGQEDICTGTPVANRERAGIDGLMGNFVNTLVLRTKLGGNPSFAQLLAQVKEVALGAYAHQDLPFELLVEALQPERSLNYTPLCQVVFELENGHLSLFKLPGLTVSPLFVETDTAKFDLGVSLENTELGLRGLWEYNTDLFDAATIARMTGHFQTLLEGIVAHPEQQLSELSLLSVSERHLMLEEWTQTQADYPKNLCIHQLFEAQVERTPDAVALVFEDRQLTYLQLNKKANQLAHHLQSLGIEPEVLVGLCVDRSIEMIVGLLGILKAGGAYVPFDLRVPSERLRLMSAEVTMLLSQHLHLKDLPEHKAHVICIDAEWEVIARHCQDNPKSRAKPENLMYVTYASKPGVLVEHQAVSQRLHWLQNTFVLDETDVVLHKAPLMQDTAVKEIFWPLVMGGRLAIVTEHRQEEPAYLQCLIAEQKVSVVNFAPSELSAFVSSASKEFMGQLNSLRLVLCSGEPLQRLVVEAFKADFKAQLQYLYSLPETSGELTSFACQSLNTQQIVPMGYPSYRAIYVLDQHLQPVPIGVKGEIYVGGTGLARGYLKAEKETAQRFVHNPFAENAEARLFKTGELGRWLNDGTLEWIGSRHRQTWIQGNYVELQTTEVALLMLTSVEDARVLVRKTLTNEPQLVAYVVLSGYFRAEQLHSELQSVLPAYQLPCAYVLLSALPLTKAGQVDEEALRRLEVIDSELVQRWEKQLISLPEIDQVAVVVPEKTRHQQPLHLMDLLLNWKTGAVNNRSEPVQNLVDPETSENKLGSTTLAISDGGLLPPFVDLPKNLAQALHRAAQYSPTKGIVYIHSDGNELGQSYTELLEQAQRIQAALTKLGLKPLEQVIFQLDQNQDFIPAFWGCVLGGFVPVPIAVASSYEQQNSTTNKLLNAWLMLGRPRVLTSAKLAKAIHCWSKRLNLENFQLETIDELRCCEPNHNWYESQPEDLALLMLTSGSTGIAKVVKLSHYNLLSMAAGTIFMNGFDRHDVTLNWMPMDHVGALVFLSVMAVELGCQQVHVPTENILQNPLKWLDLISRHRASISWAPNFAFSLLCDHPEEINGKDWDLSSMRFLVNAGEAVVTKTARNFLKLLSQHGLPSTALHPAFGMCETCSGITWSNSFSLETTTDDDAFVAVGFPIAGASVRIVDPNGQVVEEGTIGRLQLRGNSVTLGYYQNPEANQQAFNEEGWFNTGDLGFLVDGCLTVTGREKDVIIINGLNYYCHEIEAAVEEVEGVEVSYTSACAVREPKINTDKLAIFFNTSLSCEKYRLALLKEIRAKVVNSLGANPDYLIPVQKEAIPKTPIGKIQRSQLKQRFEAGEFNDILKQLDINIGNANTLPDWFYRKVWCRKESVTITPFTHLAQSLVFLDPLGVGEYLCAQLEQLNQPCVKVEVGSEFAQLATHHYRLAPGNPNHYQQMLLSLVTDNIQITQILHLWNYHEYSEVSSLEALEVAQEKGVYSLLFLVQALAKVQGSQHQVRLLVISSHTQAVSPKDAIAYEKATIVGLLKTIPQEMPWLSCCHVDLPPSSDVQWNGKLILNELRVLSKEKEVAYRDGQRWVCRLEKADLCVQPNLELPFQQGGMYLLSGGLGGIGIEIAKYLLQHYEAKLLLVGRTPLPERSTWDAYVQQTNTIAEKIKAIHAMEQFGGEILYHAVDICDLTQMQLVVAQAQSHWQCQLHGVIHLAGTYQESKLIEETIDSVSATLAPKVLGTWVLHQLLQHQPNSIFINFSSVNGFLGGTNVGAYAAANSFLDSFAQYQKYNTSLQSYCFAWSMWDEIGMSKGYQMKELTRARGYYIVTPQQGLYSLLAGLHHDQAQLVVGLDGSNRNLLPSMQSEFYSIHKLAAYYTTNRNDSSRDSFQELMVCDRFGTKSKSDFVQLEEMPLTDIGEIAREQLLSLGTQGRSGGSLRVAPRTEIERQLASIWQQVLSIPLLGIDENFFELGGNSLLATQIISRVQDVFELELPLRSLFENPTVAELASGIAVAQGQTRSVESLAIKPVARNNELPLSFAQARLWFLDQLMPGNPFYNIPFALRVAGELDVLALQRSLNEIIRRHETLRTSFLTANGQPTQLIANSLELTLATIDLQSLPKLEREQKARELASEKAQQPFDLTVAPLLRVMLLRLSPTEHVLLLVMHHIISDGWSMGVFYRELAVLYDTFFTGKSSPLPELSIQYADFAVWQRTWLEQTALKNQLQYWQQQLADLAVLELPTDYSRPAEQSYRGAVEILSLPQNLKQGLVKLSQQHGVTLFMTMLATFKVLLHRYTGQTDIVVGSPIANRNGSEIEPLIGFFANTLVLRTQIQGNVCFDELLSRVRSATLGAYAHQDLPFDRLVEALQPERHLNANPLFQVMFALQNVPMEELKLQGLQLSRLELEYNTTRFDLEWHIWEQPHGLQFMVAYTTDLFAQETIKRMLGHFQTLLEGVVANPQYRVSELPLLSATEHQQLLINWNDTDTEYQTHKCIDQLFEERVEQTPDAVAVVFSDKQLTYQELNTQANQLAHYLQAIGVGSEVIVGICMERSLAMVVGVLGILKAGGAYLPLDPRVPSERLRLMLRYTETLVVLTQQDLLGRLALDETLAICLDTEWEVIAQYSQENLISKATPESLIYVTYPSKPGVLVEHQAVSQRLHWLQNTFVLNETDVVLHKAPLVQDTAVREIFWPLVVGGRLAIATEQSQNEPADLQSLITKQKVSVVNFAPSELSAFVASPGTEFMGSLNSLRLVLCSGEPLQRSVVEAFRANFTSELHYQISLPETAGELSNFACDPLGTEQTVPISYPSYRAIYVLDQHLQPVPVGVKGEIYVGGTGLARGYLQVEEETAQRFVNNPFAQNSNARLFKTGELGRYLNDGKLEWLGSGNRQTWIKGYRVELQEVEAALLAFPSVEDARVVVRETEKNESQLVAYVVLKEPFFPEQLHSELQSVLPAYQLPHVYVPLSTLPLTKAGAVDELALSTLEVIDSKLVQHWEKQLESLPEIDQVAVVVQEQVQSQPPLHLMDLLADWKAALSNRSHLQPLILTHPQLNNGKSSSTTLAISDGGPLPQFVDVPTNLAQALHRAAKQIPTKGMIYIQSDGSQFAQSYRELLEQAQRIQAGLTKLGLKPQDIVIFQLEQNQDFIGAFWGCVLGGFVPVSIAVAPSYEQHNSTTSKLENAWQMLGRPTVLTSASQAPRICSWSKRLNLENFQLETIDELRCCEPEQNVHHSQPEDLAILLLTSGSTGVPKAVMQSHHALLSRSAASAVVNGFTSLDVSLNWLGLEHVGGIVFFHIRDVYLGCQQIHAPTQLILQDPLKWLDLIERYRVTITWAPNFAYGLINDRASDLSQRCSDLSSLRFIFNGAEAIVAKQARKFLQLLAPHGLRPTAMHPAWGMAETSSGVTYSHNFSLLSTSDEQKFVEVGAPIPGVSLRIVDTNNQVVSEDMIGSLQVKGLTITSGYYQNLELNSEVFTSDGWFKTGDLGFLHQGRLTITGRDKDLIIINGLNYYSHEIESAVEELDGVEVSYTAAVAVRDTFDYSDKLVIFFSPSVSREADVVQLTQEIRSLVVQNMGVNPEYLVPVDKQAIPKTTIGKIQRAQLRQGFEAGEFNDILKQLDINLGNANTLPDWFYRKIWLAKQAVSSTRLSHLGPSVVFLDALGVGEWLCTQLQQLKQPCVKVEVGSEFTQLTTHHYRLTPGNPNHYQQLLLSLAADNIHIAQILHLWNYNESAQEVSSLEVLNLAQDKGIYSLLFLVQALAKVQGSEYPVRLLVVSSNTQAVSPKDAIAYEKATIVGLLKTIPQEMPWLSCCHVDLASSSDVQWNGELILQELRVLSKEKEVAYRNGQRLVCRLEKVDLSTQPNLALPFEQGGMYLLSGGLGGIAIEIAKYLLQHYEAKLVLVGRTPLPERSTWDAYLQDTNAIAEKIKAIQALEQFGGEILYHAADICDLTQMQLLVAQAQSHWQCQLHGVIHLAGTYHESLLSEETHNSVSAILAPKVSGSWVLHQLLKDNSHSIFIHFSSINGFFGGTNVGAYAAANSFLDSFAQYQQHHSSLQSYCFAWSMWDEIGISRGYQMKELTRTRGYDIVSLSQGLYSFLAGLHHQPTQLLVGLDGSNRNLRQYLTTKSYDIQKLIAYFTASNHISSAMTWPEFIVCDRFGTHSKSEFVRLEEMPLTDTGEIDREQLLSFGTQSLSGGSLRVAPSTEIERQLANIWQQVLKVPVLGIHDNFFELGGNSLLATQLISRVQDVLELELPLRSLFENPTVAELSGVIVQTLSEQTDETDEDILAELEQLDDDQVRAMLKGENT